ncbi:hypothetical protein ACFQ9X_25250 [Catenulispora yoronensis]
MTAEAAARTSSRLWTKHADHVHRRTGRAIWDAAEGLPDPLTAIAAARRTAEDLLDRLARAAPEGEHLLTALARADDGYGGRPDGEEAGLAADLALSRRGPRCLTDRAGAAPGSPACCCSAPSPASRSAWCCAAAATPATRSPATSPRSAAGCCARATPSR